MTGIARGLARRVFEGVLSWPFPRPTAKALVEREGEDGRGYLLVRQERSDGEQWLVPGGGVEAGEDPRAALAREVSEETGVDVTVGEPLDAWAFDTAMGPHVATLSRCTDPAGEPTVAQNPDAEALAEARWVPARAVTDRPMPADLRRVLERYC